MGKVLWHSLQNNHCMFSLYITHIRINSWKSCGPWMLFKYSSGGSNVDRGSSELIWCFLLSPILPSLSNKFHLTPKSLLLQTVLIRSFHQLMTAPAGCSSRSSWTRWFTFNCFKSSFSLIALSSLLFNSLISLSFTSSRSFLLIDRKNFYWEIVFLKYFW